LWRVNPVLANLDGLVDYGEDYTDAALVFENMQTVYQVGKGMLARFEEEAEEPAVEGREEPLAAIEPEEAEAEEPRDESDCAEDLAVQSATTVEIPDQVRDAAEPDETAQDIQHDIPMARPTRRMRFSFSEAGA
jgi:hypothetical protein